MINILIIVLFAIWLIISCFLVAKLQGYKKLNQVKYDFIKQQHNALTKQYQLLEESINRIENILDLNKDQAICRFCNGDGFHENRCAYQLGLWFLQKHGRNTKYFQPELPDVDGLTICRNGKYKFWKNGKIVKTVDRATVPPIKQISRRQLYRDPKTFEVRPFTENDVTCAKKSTTIKIKDITNNAYAETNHLD